MATAQFAEQRFEGDRFAEINLEQPAEFWAPPLAPTATPAAADIPLREEAGLATGEEHYFQPEQTDFPEAQTSLALRRKLIAGIAIVAALGAGTLAYFFWASPGDKLSAQTAQTAPAVQSSPVAQVQAASRSPKSPPAVPVAVAWPDLPPSVTVEAAPQVASTAPPANTATRQSVRASQTREIVFLQRPGVNIRSTPAANGIVLGTAAKGARFKVTKREGDWVQVENSRLKGWISSQFLAPQQPR